MIDLLATVVVALSLTRSDPCSEASQECQEKARRSIAYWRTAASTTAVALEALRAERAIVDAPSAAPLIVPSVSSPPRVSDGPGALPIVAAAAGGTLGGVLVGLVIGLLLAHH